MGKVETKRGQQIWKYKIQIRGGAHEVTMPTDAEIIHVAKQNDGKVSLIDYLCFWALVNPKNTEVTRRFVVVGTGHPIEGVYTYIGTSLSNPFVWHLMEVKAF